MEAVYPLVAAGVVLGVVAALFGLHRLSLRRKGRSLLYDRDGTASGGPLGCLVALQRVLEPPSQHVHEIKDQRRRDVGDGAGPPPGRQDDSAARG